MGTPETSTNNLWMEGLRRLVNMWTEGVQELYATLEDVREDISMDETSTLAKEKARRLDSVLKRFASTIENVRQDIRTSVRWLTVFDLPEEVIVPIFQPVGKRSVSLVNLSLVCKRFRQITLSSPKLWSGCTLTLSIPPHIADMVVSRSGSSGLTVKLEGAYHRMVKRQDRLSKLFEHSAQWKELTAVMEDKHAMFYIGNHFPNENLSTLGSLNVSFRLSKCRQRPPSFYQNWSLPSLRILTDYTWVPPPSFASKVPKLIECHLAPKSSEFPQLIGSLNTVPDLQKLRLTMEDFDATSMDENTTLKVPALRRLRLTFQPSWIPVEHILPVLLCPGLTNLALRFHECTPEHTDITILNCKRGLPSLRSLCPCLENFTLAIYGCAGRKKLYFFDDILHHLPCTIKSIYMHLIGDIQLLSHGQSSFSEVSESTHPFLTSFSVRHQKSLGQDFFPQVAAQFKLRKIKLKEVSCRYDENVMKDTRNIFHEAGELCVMEI